MTAQPAFSRTPEEPQPSLQRSDTYTRDVVFEATFPTEELYLGQLRDFIAAIDRDLAPVADLDDFDPDGQFVVTVGFGDLTVKLRATSRASKGESRPVEL